MPATDSRPAPRTEVTLVAPLQTDVGSHATYRVRHRGSALAAAGTVDVAIENPRDESDTGDDRWALYLATRSTRPAHQGDPLTVVDADTGTTLFPNEVPAQVVVTTKETTSAARADDLGDFFYYREIGAVSGHTVWAEDPVADTLRPPLQDLLVAVAVAVTLTHCTPATLANHEVEQAALEVADAQHRLDTARRNAARHRSTQPHGRVGAHYLSQTGGCCDDCR